LKINRLEHVAYRRIILAGAMGAGKSTVGRILAEILNWEYIDNDFEMSKMASLSINELSILEVSSLHELEASYLRNILTRPAPLIAGAAASIADNLDLLNQLKNEFTVYLHVPLEDQMNRAGSIGVGRQGLVENPLDVIRERYERRDPRYRAVASLIIETTKNPENDASLIMQKLKS